ncbi:uncharacterized protein P8A3.13c [Aspergillus udagawae]|uniref:Uncharacterized protein P8A3.13c n=1 Tax=Aspergillus udagawae TaxID=91492 RepID=A0A8E0R3G3_9EURO|nr:uncharacterized protein Aud_010467 [Aspergillus udagawae]GFF24332.1 uncharacterized protein P8A3.13c [Aspergillus udagawae]GFF29844.1 uncharacterized protein P8A3.13c [Aspergillus udagawae]GFF52472.1 uncharacterized protein P8A3.13c [Aspergillus udagawae]GFG00246.1 uncharacterized protein P8A3.13c [Aspergillus udagawae]GFG19586.1 uncharacterized protein P8A3.13c [Aspergillus udagawae]
MPPENTPSQGISAQSPPLVFASSLQQLSTVSTPVPTLPAAASHDAHDDNVIFLRSRVRSPHGSSSSSRQRRRRHQILSEFESDPMELDESTGVRMSVEISRHPIVRRTREEPTNMPNYEGRVSNIRSLYGWAPGSDEDDEDDLVYEPLQDPNSISSWFGRLSDRNTTSRRHIRRDATARSPLPLPVEPLESSRHRMDDSTVATAEALLQSVRRQPRLSRTRTLHNYLLDRERTSQDSEDGRERATQSPTSRAYRFIPTSRGESNQISTHGDMRARVNAHRQLHMDHPPSPRLKEIIRYLDRLRYSTSFEESLSSAAAGGFVQLDFSWDEDDFILDTTLIAPPPPCSWLRPGMVFKGSQMAACTPTSIFAHRGPTSHPATEPVIVNGSDNGRISVYTTTGRRYLANNNIHNFGTGKDENWPVKVTIHNINYQEMTLSGTMEAYNIPDKTSPSHDAHIVTFLEGEIIDFNTHTLETKNFKADAETDSTYWRELQPFKNLTDDEMTRNLVSRKWITEELSKRWILMRWKERCFITPTDARQGLTISGFYYISLRRDTGHIEGLYYDPGSSPYQQLSLKPETEKMIRPSYNFR